MEGEGIIRGLALSDQSSDLIGVLAELNHELLHEQVLVMGANISWVPLFLIFSHYQSTIYVAEGPNQS